MKFRNWFWGLFFILAAVLIIVNQMGFLAGVSILNLLITILLIPIFIKSVAHLNFAGILFPLAIAGILYAGPLGIQAFTPWPILIVALFGSIGLTFIFPHRMHHRRNYYCGKGSKHEEEGFEEVIDIPDENIVDFSVRFGASVKYINSDALKQANLQCSFGAMSVYFDHVTLSPNGAEINLDVSFAGVELYIPKEWQVINKVNTVLGAIDEKNPKGNKEGPKVTLVGKTSFSGVDIIYI